MRTPRRIKKVFFDVVLSGLFFVLPQAFPLTPGIRHAQAAVNAYQVQNCDGSGNLDTACSATSEFSSAQTIEMIEDGSGSCSGTKEDKIKFSVATTSETNILTTYFGTGYGSNMAVTSQSSGNDINFKSKNVGGTFTLYLYEADPSDGSLIGTALDSITKSVTAGTGHIWTDLSGLSGTVSSGNTLAFKMTFTPADTTSSDIETKWGLYDTSGKQMLFSVDETVAYNPLTGVSNSPSPNTVSDTSTHTVSFTTASALPSDGKIAVTFPAGFDLTAVGNTDITSTTMDGSFTVSLSGQELTISRSGGSSQSAAAENIIIADITNTATAGASYTVTVETQNSGGTTIDGPTTSSTFTILCSADNIYSHQRLIVIDHTKVGTDNTGTLPATGFPVLVSLSGDWLKTTTADPTNGRITDDDGDDIIFKQGCSTLYHEIEEYDGTTGTLVAWVRVDSLSKAADTTICMLYGSASVSSPTEDPENVWDSNFKGVWHLAEDVTDEQTSGTHEDSTSNGNDGSQNKNGPVAGHISGGQDFDATDDYIIIDNVADDINVTKGSASAWIKMNDMPDRGRVVGAFTDSNNGWLIEWSQTQGGVKFNYEANGVNSLVTDTGTTDTDGLEHFVTLTWDTTAGASGEVKAFTDGVQVGSTQTGLGTWAGAINRVYIGASADDANLEFDGMIDEVRISSTARDADWIKTEYNNQSDTTIGDGYFIKTLSEATDFLTGVGNSPSPNTASDTSTHTVSFTTASALPSDGKIAVRFPAGFDLAGVGNADISSSTMDGSFTVSRSGQELTITRSGGSSQSAAAENIIIADITNTATAGTSYTVTVETRTSGGTPINGPTTSSAFTIKGKSALADPAIQVTDQLSGTVGTQPSDVELVGFKITPTGENLTWTGLTVSLTYGGGMADADITNARIYVDNGTVGTYESGTDTQVGSQSVNASSGSLTWNTVGGTVTAATNYLIIFDAGATLSEDETVQASVTAANITVTGATTSASITTSGDVDNEPLHTFSSCGDGVYSYQRSIVIDYTKVGTDNTGTLPATGFPVLISLSGNWLKTTTVDAENGRIESADGWDIIFKRSTSTLYHEIEKYDGTNGILVAWVRVDSLSKATDTIITMLYGNGCVTSPTEDPENVWDENFKGVWHLVENQTGTGNSDLYTDSTSNGNHGDDYISATGKTGQIASGQQFDGSDDYVGMGNVLDYGQNDPMTYSAWIKTSGNNMQIAGKANHTGRYQGVWFFIGEFDSGELGFYLYDDYLLWERTKYKYSSASFNDNEWHYVAATYSGNDSYTGITLYGDGSELSIGGWSDDTLGTVTNSYPFNIGAVNNGQGYRFNGYIDEVRLSDTVRSADWIKTEYNNQSDTTIGSGHFIKSLSDEEAACTFLYRRPIVIDHSKVGTDNSGTLPATGFPVLVSLSGNWLKTTAADPTNGRIENANGYDIIFRESDRITNLYHEIEKYDGTTGTLVAWVRIDSLSKETDTTFYMYYGNACIEEPSEDPENVWDTSFKGVWHLKESGNGTAGEFKDSTSNNSDGQGGSGDSSKTPAQSTSGQIGNAQNFDGSDDYIDLGNSSTLQPSSLTVSLWAKRTGAGDANTWQDMVGDQDWNSAGYLLFLDPEDTGVTWRLHTTGTHYDISASGLTTTDWHLYTGTFSGSTALIYVDGVEQNHNYSAAMTPTTTNGISIGNDAVAHGNGFFAGLLDELRISSTARDADWIKTEFNNQSDTTIGDGYFIKSLGDEDTSFATAVNLLSFTATGRDGSVLLSWETAQEISNMGFHLYRAASPAGPFTRITERLLPGMGLSTLGKKYTYEDTAVTPGRLYYYKLEDIDVYGKSTFHGPVCVDWDGDGIPDDWERAYFIDSPPADSGLDPDQDGLSNREEYERGTDPLNPDTDGDGIPDGEERKRDGVERASARTFTRGVEILASDGSGITLELRTDAFDMQMVEAEGEVFERLRVLDYLHGFTTHVGKPELPVKGALIDLPDGKSFSLRVEGTEVETLCGLRVYPVPEKVVEGEGEMTRLGEVFQMDGEAYGSDRFYPFQGDVARPGERYTFRGREKLQVLFYPFAFNPKTGELMHYRRIRVRVDFVDSSPGKRTVMALMAEPLDKAGSSARSVLAWTPPSETYRILVSEEGIYRLTKSDLEGAQVDLSGLLPSQVRLYNLGVEIPIHVYDLNGDDHFDNEDYIEFYGRLPAEGYAKYAKSNVYWLAGSGSTGSPKRMAETEAAPKTAPVAATHTFTYRHEKDEWYWQLAPGTDSLDRWFFYPFAMGDGVQGGGSPVSFPFTLGGVSGKGSLRISMAGVYDTDHVVDLSLNGKLLGTYTWSRIAFHEAVVEDVDLVEGENTLALLCRSGIDSIALDRVDLTYPKSFAARDNELKFTHGTGSRYQVSGFTSNDLLAFDITSPTDVSRIVHFQVTGANPHTLDFEPPAEPTEKTYLVLSAGEVKTPESLSKDTVSNLFDPANEADYILITLRELGWDGNGNPNTWLRDLVSLREGQGLRVKVVDVEDVFDEFSYGISSPSAVRDFLKYAYENWVRPAPRYVLLVGDGTYDPKGNWSWFSVDSTPYLPAYLTYTEFTGETVTDEWFVQVSGSDALPDLYMGRLPAASVDQAGVMVNKIIAYENAVNTKTWEKNVLLVADNQTVDYEAVFETMNEDVASLIPNGFNPPFKGYLNEYLAAADLTADLKAKINEGALVVHYSGHGSQQILANEHIFRNGDVAGLVNGNMLPLLVSMSCLSGYFITPESWGAGSQSLIEALMRAEGKGVAAALMPTGLTATNGQHILDGALFENFFTNDVRVLGEAVLLAKQALLANGTSFGEVSETFLLFGDPAMKLKNPLPRKPLGLEEQETDEGVSLTWQEATDCDGAPVSGYNLYRRPASGGEYTRLNSGLITALQFEDTSAPGGTAYDYVVTSVDSDGDESVLAGGLTAVEPAQGNLPLIPEESDLEFPGAGGCFIDTAARGIF